MTPDIRLFESKLLGERYFCYHHKSGMRIAVFPKEMSTTHAMLMAGVGSVDNIPDGKGGKLLPAGMAHFLEHKLFSNEDGSDAFEHFSALGADANAYTSNYRTAYYFSCTERFSEALSVLIEFFTHPFFEEKSVEREKGIIAEEIRMCFDDPYDRVYHNMLRALYKNHPVNTEICGTVESISKITPALLYLAYEVFYKPANTVLAVCGNVDPAEVFEIANRLLPDTADTSPAPRQQVDEPSGVVCAEVVEERDVARPIFAIGVKNAGVASDFTERVREGLAITLLLEMLFSPSSELYNSLLDEGLISSDFSADLAHAADCSFIQISGESDAPRAVFERIKAYLREKKQTGLDFEDFERCRRVAFAEQIKSFDSTEEIVGTLAPFVLEGESAFLQAEMIDSMTFSYVSELFSRLFLEDAIALSVIFPKKEEKK